MNFTFYPAAKTELNEAVDYYEDCQPGLGYEFAKEVYTSIALILRYPEGWSELSLRTRHCFTKRFPYAIVYEIKSGFIRIIAIAHTSRRPKYWDKRLKDNP